MIFLQLLSLTSKCLRLSKRLSITAVKTQRKTDAFSLSQSPLLSSHSIVLDMAEMWNLLVLSISHILALHLLISLMGHNSYDYKPMTTFVCLFVCFGWLGVRKQHTLLL